MKVSNRSRHLAVAFILSACALCLIVTSGAAASPISAKKARLEALQGKLQTVYTQAEIATEKYDQANSQLQTVNAQIVENEHLLALAEHNLLAANRQLKARAQDIYKARDVSVIDVLFSSGSFNDMITELNMMQRLSISDVDTVHVIAAYRRNIKDRRLQLDLNKKAAARLVADCAARKTQILGYEAKLKKMTKGLRAEIKRMQAQAALRAKLALQGYSGPIPKVDPNSPGHPEIVAIAQRYLGVPYVWGGDSPAGFDCSGLAQYCYAQAGISIPRCATEQQRASIPVPFSDLRPGDLVFFGGPAFSHHVAIFVGGTTIIEAPYTGAVVSYGTYTGRDAWIGGRF